MADPRGRTMLRTRSTTSIQQAKSTNLDTKRARLIHHTHNIRTQEDLRHTALRSEFQKSSSRLDTLHLKPNDYVNQHLDSTSALRAPVKNIPMIQTSNDRWTNFQMTSHQPEATRPTENSDGLRPDIAKSSISPLTNIKSLTSSTASSTTAAPIQTPQAISLLKPSGFLQRVQTPATENRFEELESLLGLVTSAAKSQPSKNRGFLSKVSSLLPFDRRQDELAKPTEVQEVESSEENDDLDDEPTQNSVFNEQQMHFSPLTTMDFGSVATVLDMLGDVQLPQLKEQPKPIRGGFGATRTQQKILDLKDLAEEEKQTLSGQKYSHKIQHESVRAQWTQIRLRYLSYLVDRKNVACRAGVLGFLYRYPNHSRGDEKVDQVTWKTKDETLMQLWTAALAILDPDKGADMAEDSDVYGTTKVLLASAREALLHRASRTALHLPRVAGGVPEMGQDLEIIPGV